VIFGKCAVSIFCPDDSSPATPDEIIAFKARHAKLAEDSIKLARQQELDDVAWRESTRTKLIAFLADAYAVSKDKVIDDYMDSWDYCLENSDDDALCYDLATSLYDIDCDCKFLDLKTLPSSDEDVDRFLIALKKHFGQDHYNRVLENYFEGNHDT
jgi:hypothetical protein